MKIEAVDFYYLSMPEVLDIGDGSQDLLLVRLQAGPHVGWGECEASPLVSIASLVCPMSHSACKPVRDSVLGQTLDDVADIDRIGDLVRANSLDLLQADHTLSGIDIAMWDLLGRRFDEPVYSCSATSAPSRACPTPPSSSATRPPETLRQGARYPRDGLRRRQVRLGAVRTGKRRGGRRAGRGGAGRAGRGGDPARRRRHRLGARPGRGRGAPAGAAGASAPPGWRSRSSPARSMPTARWRSGAGRVRIAGGEGSHNEDMARHMIDHGGVGFIQIDAGRIGGISPAKRVADYAQAARRHLRQPHLHLAPGAQRLAATVRRAPGARRSASTRSS